MSGSDKQPRPARTARIIINHDGSVEYEGDPAVIAVAIVVDVRGRARAARRRKAWGRIGVESMARLVALFPSLREAPGVNPWNTDEFLPWAVSGVLSHGEVLAAKFVLAVWNPTTDWEKAAQEKKLLEDGQHFARFDLFEAMSVWDQEHVDAALAWIELPFFP
jgi:hypothetical protein